MTVPGSIGPINLISDCLLYYPKGKMFQLCINRTDHVGSVQPSRVIKVAVTSPRVSWIAFAYTQVVRPYV